MKKTINSVLIANRGEIALRIIRTGQRLGLRCIAVYSEADARTPFVLAADEAVCIGPAEAARSYLDTEKVLAAARDTGADAVHPGYGFLSENTTFAGACEDAGITFIGPPASAIAAMGSKSAAKALMEKAGVPLVPGYHGDDQDPDTFAREAQRIGFPLLIKASAGGGGKGMRVVRNANALQAEVEAAQREARSAFGDSHLLLERYLETPRHVEVQVFFDAHGQGRYLFDRDCSVQRRHQKIIEEAPAPGIAPEVRRAMGEAAVRCGDAIGYVGAGTVEFLYEPSGEFFFMEMNTRLQVEHPVTETITGLDLVEWQLRVAAGEPLPWAQQDLRATGHAIEARVYAEDPDHDFLPQTGRLTTLREPAVSSAIRVDSGVTEGLDITPWYDPMLAKVIARGDTREEAISNLRAALRDYHAAGVVLNVDYVHRVLSHPAFVGGELTTHFVETWADDLARPPFELSEKRVLSWLAWLCQTRTPGSASPWPSPWQKTTGFRLGEPEWQPCEVDLDGQRHEGHYRLESDQRAALSFDDGEQIVQWQPADDRALSVRLGHRRVRLDSSSHGDEINVFADAATWTVRLNHPEVQQGAAVSETRLTAPMHGRVTAVFRQQGDSVKAGEALLVMEAMKMEHTLRSGVDARIVSLDCQPGDSVEAAQLLVELEPEETAE